jgi:hypothetical protein
MGLQILPKYFGLGKECDERVVSSGEAERRKEGRRKSHDSAEMVVPEVRGDGPEVCKLERALETPEKKWLVWCVLTEWTLTS